MDIETKKLERVLTNLLSNAIKFTPEYGKILVVAKKVEFSEKPHLQILVKDNGIGISAKQLPYIFNRFHQANPSYDNQGTGIGLALVKELMDDMHGSIKVESELEKGTSFFLSIPIQNHAPLLTEPIRLDFGIKSIDNKQLTPNLTEELLENGSPLLLIIEDNIDITKVKYVLSKETLPQKIRYFIKPSQK